MNRTHTLVPLLAALGLAACAKKTQPVAVEHPVEKAAVADVDPAAGKQIPEPVAQIMRNMQRVHFAFDASNLEDDARQALQENAQIMLENREIRLEVQGHCDERGTTEYNVALGDRRAKTVHDYLIRAGVPKERLTMLSYGKEKPLMSGHGEHVWSKNRRADFRITWGTGTIASVKGTTD